MSARASTWRIPMALGALCASGLASALFFDSWGDVWSWLALSGPLAAAGWFASRLPSDIHRR